MNSAEKQAVLHCLKSMIDEEVCEECPLYGTTGTDHCEKDCVRLAINALSSSENPNKWIPCSERLPEIHQDVILSLRSLDIEVGFRAETEPYFYCYGADSCYIDPKNVIAWMPLPTPYKSEIPTGAEGSDKE